MGALSDPEGRCFSLTLQCEPTELQLLFTGGRKHRVQRQQQRHLLHFDNIQ